MVKMFWVAWKCNGSCHIWLMTILFGRDRPNNEKDCFCWKIGWLCWGLTSQSTIFQSCRDGAIASWIINQYFRGVKCLAQGHNTAAVGFEPRTSRSGVRHSTTEPPRSPLKNYTHFFMKTCQIEIKFGFWKNFVVFSLLVIDFRAVWWQKDSHQQLSAMTVFITE